MPTMGWYIETPTGSVTTRGTNCSETFHRCLRVFIRAGQACAVALHCTIVGFTAKYNLHKLAWLHGTPPGAVGMDF
jgi:hypothetical protein